MDSAASLLLVEEVGSNPALSIRGKQCIANVKLVVVGLQSAQIKYACHRHLSESSRMRVSRLVCPFNLIDRR